jgi:hypothetical protein
VAAITHAEQTSIPAATAPPHATQASLTFFLSGLLRFRGLL